MPADEALFLQPAPESAGDAAADFCLGVVQVTEVRRVLVRRNAVAGNPLTSSRCCWWKGASKWVVDGLV
jgi:hypothetical protein